jgi:hypothetical protein
MERFIKQFAITNNMSSELVYKLLMFVALQRLCLQGVLFPGLDSALEVLNRFMLGLFVWKVLFT